MANIILSSLQKIVFACFFSRDMLHMKDVYEVKSLSRVRLFVTPWTIAYQTALSMGFSRQEYWNGLPFPSPGKMSIDVGFVIFSPLSNWKYIVYTC